MSSEPGAGQTDKLIKEIGEREDPLLSPMLAYTKYELDDDNQTQETQNWSRFLRDLSSLRNAAANAEQIIRKEVASRSKNVDAKRNMIWSMAALVYEDITGHSARASVRAPGRANEGDADGPFVRFLKALMATVPNVPEPSGHQIRGFVRQLREHGPQKWRVLEFY